MTGTLEMIKNDNEIVVDKNVAEEVAINDEKAITLLLNGDKESFALIFTRYQKMISHYIYNHLMVQRKLYMLDDIVQETFIKAYMHMEKYNGKCKLSTWLITIARNTMFDYLRKEKSLDFGEIDPALPNRDTSMNPQESLDKKETLQKLDDAMNKLPDTQKTAFYLAKFEDKSYVDIADEMNTTVSGVKSLVFRATTSVKQHMQDYRSVS